MNINKNMKISDIILMNNEAIGVFNEFGMKCTLCQGSSNETLEWAAKINNIKLDSLLEELNKLNR
ncbi:DUF1858 domain-containing protein [Clostridium sp. D2Q-14]|uniref:DUF1858 domain-containing protein n=1 Tax=Anaeromonas gelatinilytica TaxID=2683194 RepID=UPI00193BF4C9|nr:DUF1858 domain-containing protein [Anaeromonas gelatinilytica]MBS4535919.1 DUF1858 domain-containing protein [Anaeromonas gelatinilytica]